MLRSLAGLAAGAVLLVGSASAGAQRPGAGAAVDSAMAPLGWLVGEWRGTGTMQTQTGSEVAAVHEKVEGRLGGRVLIMEGVGREPSTSGNGRVVHHAFGVLSYDPEKKQHVFRAFRDGGVVEAQTLLADGVFTWEIPIPQGRSRYQIRKDGEEWLETGEYSTDGTTWRKFFEMRLRRVSPASQ